MCFLTKCFLFYEFCLCLLAWNSNSIIVKSKGLVTLRGREGSPREERERKMSDEEDPNYTSHWQRYSSELVSL